jgi:hypothetical protein
MQEQPVERKQLAEILAADIAGRWSRMHRL